MVPFLLLIQLQNKKKRSVSLQIVRWSIMNVTVRLCLRADANRRRRQQFEPVPEHTV